MAGVGLLDYSRQWFKSRVGVDRLEISRDLSLCRGCCQSGRRQVVEDTLADESLRAHPRVIGPPEVRFLAAAPLITRDGHSLGSLCIPDARPRRFTDAEPTSRRTSPDRSSPRSSCGGGAGTPPTIPGH